MINLFTLPRENKLQAAVTEYIQGVTLRDIALIEIEDKIKAVKSAYTQLMLVSPETDTSALEAKGQALEDEKKAVLKAAYKYTKTDADKTLAKAWQAAQTESEKEEALQVWFAAQGCGTLSRHMMTDYVRKMGGSLKGTRRDHAKAVFDKERSFNIELLISILATQYLNSGIIKKDVIAPELVKYFEQKKAEIAAKKAAAKAAKKNAK